MSEQSEGKVKGTKQRPASSKQTKVIQQSDDEEDEDQEFYETLPVNKEEHRRLEIDYRLRSKDGNMYLPGDFCIPKETYDNLFDHQKQGI